MYAQTSNFLCASNKVFGKYGSQGGGNPNPPPLRTPLSLHESYANTWIVHTFQKSLGAIKNFVPQKNFQKQNLKFWCRNFVVLHDRQSATSTFSELLHWKPKACTNISHTKGTIIYFSAASKTLIMSHNSPLSFSAASNIPKFAILPHRHIHNTS